jgi:hypothetical protein
VASAGVLLGGSISDSATLTGGGIGATAPTGSIIFRLFGPNDQNCVGPVIFTSTTLVTGNGVYSSAPFTPLALGTYRWIANYGGDANNNPTANTCNAPNEFVNVVAAAGGGGLGRSHTFGVVHDLALGNAGVCWLHCVAKAAKVNSIW